MDFKYAELCRNVTIMNGPVYPFAVVMNKDVWDSLPDDVKKVMDDLGLEQCDWTGKYMDDHVNESVEWSKKTYNIDIVELAGGEKARWDEKLAPITAGWVAKAKEKDLPGEEIVTYLKGFVAK